MLCNLLQSLFILFFLVFLIFSLNHNAERNITQQELLIWQVFAKKCFMYFFSKINYFFINNSIFLIRVNGLTLVWYCSWLVQCFSKITTHQVNTYFLSILAFVVLKKNLKINKNKLFVDKLKWLYMINRWINF